jgi:hypothetical protein
VLTVRQFTVADNVDANNAGAGAGGADVSSAAAAATSTDAAAAASSTDAAAAATATAAATGTGASADGAAAIALNAKFASVKAGDACTDTAPSCAGDAFAQCVNGVIVAQACNTGTVCRAVPLVNSSGTTVSCDIASDAAARIAATGATARRRRSFAVQRRS